MMFASRERAYRLALQVLARHMLPARSQLHTASSQITQAVPLPRTLLSLRRFSASSETLATTAAQPSAIKAHLRNWKQLSKFRLSLLVASTASAGYVLGSDAHVDWGGLALTSLGTFLTAAAANTCNQMYEVSSDALMKRTCNRPLPQGRITQRYALAFALANTSAGTALLYYSVRTWLFALYNHQQRVQANPLTASLGVANIALYAGVYTPLKAVSLVNTYVGAIVGAVPPLMGWAAAAGSLNLGSTVLAAGLYFWQLPHFMALAWICREDYARGGYRMLSVMDATGRRVAACCFRNCIYMFPLGAAAVALGVTSYPFAYYSALVTGGLCATAGVFYQSPTMPHARLLFRASLLHLPLWMAGLIAYRRPDAHVCATWEGLGANVARWRRREVASTGADEEQPRLVYPAPFPFLPAPSFASSVVRDQRSS